MKIDISTLFWPFFIMVALQPLLKKRLLLGTRQKVLATLEKKRDSRVIVLINKEETMSFRNAGAEFIDREAVEEGGAGMFTKQRRGSGRICWGFLSGVVSLAFLSMNGFAAEGQGGKKTDPQAGNPQAERMDLQKGSGASKIIDRTVKNDGGEELGEVDELIMSRNGKIKKVILSVGGFLGVGDRLVAVPFKSLQISEKGDVVYNATKQQLEKHPVFTYEREGFDGYYYSPPPPYGSFALPPPGYQGYFPYGHPYGSFPRGRYRGEYGAWGWEYYPERLRVSGILHRSVWNETGQEVSEMDDLIIGQNAKVEKIILSAGGFLGMEEKLMALPFKPLKVNGAAIVYNVTQQQLKDLPGFHYDKR